MIRNHPPSLHEEGQRRFQERLTMALVQKRFPFTILEDPVLKEAVQVLHPDAKLPTRQKAASFIL